MTAATAALVGLVALAAASDLRTRRIPDALTGAGLVVALALRAPGGPGDLTGGLLGAGLMFLIVVPLLALGAFGGGDGKLLIAVGAFTGPSRVPAVLLATALAGGVLALAVALRRGVLLAALIRSRELMRYAATGGRAGARPSVIAAHGITVPYGTAIAAGALVTWFFGGG